ncbi:MAG: hypothetical protein FWF28_02165 [Micrococcales bacterium]|nr:hypothetical protein [Micrococcales bacterium]
MAIQEYLNTHQVFTADDFRRAFPASRTNRNLLNRAVTNGHVDRPKRGLYVSRVGAYSRSSASPFDVALKAADDAVFCFTSALQLHGVLHNVAFLTQFYTARKVAPFDYADQEYRPIRLPSSQAIAALGLFTPTGHRYQVTTREQTLVDCLDRVSLAGGPENTLRSIAGFRHLDVDAVVEIAERCSSASLQARLGWVLEAMAAYWGVAGDVLAALAGSLTGGPYYFPPAAELKNPSWVNRWKLYLPAPEPEMIAWLNQ